MEMEMTAANFLRDLIRIEALSGQEQALCDRVIAEWQHLGFDQAYRDDIGNAVGMVKGQEPGPAWLLLTHLDHVHAGDPAQWQHPPYEAVLENGSVHGRGAVDIKGPLAAQTYALAQLLGRGERPLNDVWITAPVQEETGGLGAAHFVTHPPAQMGAVIVGEPSNNQLMLGHRGVARLKVRFTGRAHHASLALNDENPIFALAEFLKRVQAKQFADYPVTGPSSLSATQIFTDSGSDNLTPNTVDVMLSWRYNESDAENRATLAELLAGLPAEGHLEEVWTPANTPGFATSPEHPLAQKVGRYAKRFHAEPGVWKFATDGRYTAREGWPTVGWGPGDQWLAHTTQEAILVEDLDAYSEALSALLLNERASS
ncbi:M20 family metallopeptidase [Deinococcus detaillensis]|uniref:M20 family metallopeptidase n=2 Tax=Deinococcus detaillensis TaxID=2592048 RepID=A0A553UPD5_9DEIO|nr:M20 family metallopeptidase [Deinococcus detaillensis]